MLKNNREIEIQMEYPKQFSLPKEERDEMLAFIRRIIKSYISDGYEVKISIFDEYGKEILKL